MSWLPSLMLRRMSAHRGVLTVVAALAVVTCAVAGCLTVLVTTSQARALGASMAALDDHDLAVVADLSFAAGSTGAGPGVLQGLTDTTAKVLAGVVAPLRAKSGVWAETVLMPLDDELSGPRTFLASISDPQLVRLVKGRIPAPNAPAQADGAIPVAVPAVAAEANKWTPGTHFALSGSTTTFVVTGVYEPAGLPSAWSFDQLGGTGFDPAFPLPQYAGTVRVPVFGPLLAPQHLVLARQSDIAGLQVTVTPDPAHLDAATATRVRARLADAPALLHAKVGDLTLHDTVTTNLGDALGDVESRLAVTRTGVLAVGLVALVLGAAAALLAARLLIEQRDAERSLMSSRGTSRRQHLLLAALEATGIAVLSAALAAPLASAGAVAVTRWLTHGRAGGIDLASTLRSPEPWAGAAACALVLVGLLVTPAARTQEDDAAESIARPAASGNLRAVLSQSAGAAALTLVAAVCVWQLASRGTPSADGGTDPVLVAAPALLVLAAGLLVVQGLPLVARLTDLAAARSRGLVVPLASWESGRRPARSAGAVLVVTLAVATSVFSLVTNATWRASMSAQAALAVGAPAVLSDVTGATPAAVVAKVDSLEAGLRKVHAPVRFAPVVRNTVDVQQADDGAAHQVGLLATDDAGLLRGRLEPVAGLPGDATWSDVGKELLVPSTPHGYGTPLPAGTTALDLDVTVTAPEGAITPVTVGFVTEDERGVRIEHPLVIPGSDLGVRCYPDAGACPGEVDLRTDPASGGTLRLVGLDVVAGVGIAPTTGPGGSTVEEFPLDVTVGDVRALAAPTTTTATTTAVGWGTGWAALSYPADPFTATSLDQQPGFQESVKTTIDGGSLTIHRQVWSPGLAQGGDGFVAAPAVDGKFPGASPQYGATQAVPVVVNQELADELDVGIDDILVGDGTTSVTYQIVGVVKNLPRTTGPGMLARRDVLQVAEALHAVPPRMPDEWVAPAGAASAAPLKAAASDVGVLATLDATRAELQDGPDRVGLQVALWVACAAAVVMAAVGTATTMAAGLRRRRVELARLQALGIPRRALVRAALAEHGILASVGLVGGAVTGLLAAFLVSRSLAVGLDGRPPVPDPLLRVPWGQLSALAALLLLLVAGTAAVTARLHVGRARSELLRLGADR